MTFVVKAARHVPIAAVAHFEGIIQIWELETGERLSTFRSVYDGQTRLAISRIGESVVAANWRSGPTGGVACYDTRTGDKLWHRTGLGQVHTMRFSEQGPWVWCDIESQPVHCLDANTGETLATWPAVQRIFDGPFSPRHLLLVSHASFVIGTMEKHITIPRANSSFRDVAFTPDAAILCERDVVRSIHIETGKELWTYAPSEGDSMTRLSFQSDDCVYGIKSSRPRVGEGVVTLMRFSRDGQGSEVCRLGSNLPYDGFGAGVFVAPDGEIVSLQTGTIVKRLMFDLGATLDGSTWKYEDENRLNSF